MVLSSDPYLITRVTHYTSYNDIPSIDLAGIAIRVWSLKYAHRTRLTVSSIMVHKFRGDKTTLSLYGAFLRVGSVRFGLVWSGSFWFGFGSVLFGSVRFSLVRLGSARFGVVRYLSKG